MITCTIEDHEEHKLACFGIPGAYLHTLNDEDFIMLLKRPLEELMVIVDPLLYRNNVIYDSKGVSLFYFKMNKALYGLLKSTLLFYNNLRVELESIGLKSTPTTLVFSTRILIAPR